MRDSASAQILALLLFSKRGERLAEDERMDFDYLVNLQKNSEFPSPGAERSILEPAVRGARRQFRPRVSQSSRSLRSTFEAPST